MSKKAIVIYNQEKPILIYEIKEFFDVVLEHKKPLYGFEQDKKILAIIDSMGA